MHQWKPTRCLCYKSFHWRRSSATSGQSTDSDSSSDWFWFWYSFFEHTLRKAFALIVWISSVNYCYAGTVFIFASSSAEQKWTHKWIMLLFGDIPLQNFLSGASWSYSLKRRSKHHESDRLDYQPLFRKMSPHFGATLERLWFRRQTFHVLNLMHKFHNVSSLTEMSVFRLLNLVQLQLRSVPESIQSV